MPLRLRRGSVSAVRERQEAEHRGQANMVRGMLEMLDDLAPFEPAQFVEALLAVDA